MGKGYLMQVNEKKHFDKLVNKKNKIKIKENI